MAPQTSAGYVATTPAIDDGNDVSPASRRTGEGVDTLLAHLRHDAAVLIQPVYDGVAAGDGRESRAAAEKVKHAHVAWNGRRVILAEAESRVVASLDVFARSGRDFPHMELEALKAGRVDCTEAFDCLVRSLNEASNSAGQDLAQL